MYDADVLLAAVDANAVPVLSLCAVALVGNYIYWIQSLRAGWKHRVHTMPIGCVLFFLPHDATFVAYYGKWFVEYDHWFLKLWWCGLCVTVLMELAFLYLILKFARRALMPNVTDALFTAMILGGLAAVTVAWLVVKSSMNDEFFLIIFGITIFWCAPFTFGMMAVRNSAVGQLPSAWAGFLLMPLAYWPALFLLDEYFRSPLWLLLGAVTVAFGCVNIFYIGQLNRQAAPASVGREGRRPV